MLGGLGRESASPEELFLKTGGHRVGIGGAGTWVWVGKTLSCTHIHKAGPSTISESKTLENIKLWARLVL